MFRTAFDGTEHSFSAHNRALAYTAELERTDQSFGVQIRQSFGVQNRASAYRAELLRTDQSFGVQNRALSSRTKL